MLTALNRYWDYLRIERQMSPHTITNYQHQLDATIKILAQQDIHAWTQVTPSVVRFILAESKKQGLKRKKLGFAFIRIASISQFFGATRRIESESRHRYFCTETR